MKKDTATGYKQFEPGSKKPHAGLIFTEKALLKIVGLIENFDGEVGWHGTAVRSKKTSFTIEDIFVYPQDATPASVDTDQSGYEQWLYTQPNEIFNKMRMHGHSHYKYGVTPSSRDDDHRNGIVEQLVDDMFYIFLIWNREYKISVLLYDHKTGILYDTRSIDIFVQSGKKSIPIKEINLKDFKAKLAGDEEIAVFLTNAKSVVEIRENKSNKAISRLIRDKEFYSLLYKYAGQDIRLQAEESDEQQSILELIAEDGTEIMRLSGDEKFIRIVWSIDDVKSIRPDLSDEECMSVLERVERKHDTTIGISWDTLELRAEELYPKPNDAETYGKFVKNSVAEFFSATYDGNMDYICENTIILSGNEVMSRIVFCQDIETNRLYHHWYGGRVASITVSFNGKEASGDIDANGDVRVYLYDKENNVLCNIKDKSNNAGFCELSRYISDDKLLAVLLNHEDNEHGFSLRIDDSNWWELYPDADDSTVVLSDYSLTDAIGEAVEILYKHLESEENANEPE